MDLSALIGEEASDLNADLGATSLSGEALFSSPFGAATAYLTKLGVLRIGYTFNPHEEYPETCHVASITSDYTAALRDALTKHLLPPEAIAPRRPSEEEVVMETLVKVLPAKVLAEEFFKDKEVLDKYITMVKKRVSSAYKEEMALGDVLQSKPFEFVFSIGIDAFPNRNLGIKDTHIRKGVLTFYIQSGKAPGSSSESAAEDASSGSSLSLPKQEEHGASSSKSKDSSGRRSRSASQIRREDAEELAAIKESLGFGRPGQSVAKGKVFPESTDDFFDAIGRWFSSTVRARAEKLQSAAGNRQMYQ